MVEAEFSKIQQLVYCCFQVKFLVVSGFEGKKRVEFENPGSAYGNLIHHLPCNHWLLRHDLGRLAARLRRSQGGGEGAAGRG
jgi:hypothetical protein